MIQEDKELLLTDLCARLRYGIKCHFKYGTSEGDIILKCIDGNVARFDYGWYGKFHVIIDPQYIKPYLRPMSSMTKEEKNEYRMFIDYSYNDFTSESFPCVYVDKINDYLDWLNKNKFDYRGLIPMGLALEAPEGMYNN